MSVKPILFNTEMVRAILDGRKTVTRRVWKDWNKYAVPDMSLYDADKGTYAVHTFEDPEHTKKTSMIERRCPICPGDILYVRETFVQAASHIFWYKADNNSWLDSKNMRWKPSIHMPKEAARIFLKVTDVRVERLQEITLKQIEQESIDTEYPHTLNGKEKIYAFRNLWNSTIKKSDIDTYGWDADPYVWVIDFEMCERPEKK